MMNINTWVTSRTVTKAWHADHKGKIRNIYKSLFRKPEGKDILKHQRLDGRIILKRMFAIHQRFSYFFFPWRKKYIKKRRLLAHGNYSSISNCRTKILAIFHGIVIMFCSILK